MQDSGSDKKFAIVITSYRHRWCDNDNLAGCKWMIDTIVEETGILPDDSGKFIDMLIKRVEKVPKSEEERTTIEIYSL